METVTGMRLLLYLAALLSLAAGAIHGVLTPEHWEEWWGYGAFFLALYLAQGAYGVLLLLSAWRAPGAGRGGGRFLYPVGIVGNLASIAVYAVSRTVGVPFFGPEAGEVESVTTIGLGSKGIEVALVGCLVVLLRRHTRSTRRVGYTLVD